MDWRRYLLFIIKIDIINCSFGLNTASGRRGGGGALFSQNTTLLIDGCSFRKNMAEFGGAIVVVNTNQYVIVSKSTFQSNCIKQIGIGGAISLLNSEGSSCFSCVDDSDKIPKDDIPVFSILSCFFISNGRGIFAGAIYADKGVLNVLNSEFKENSASLGGALLVRFSFAYFHGNSFFDNQAMSFGGSVYITNTVVHSSNNTYSNNTSKIAGGVINAFFSSVYSYKDFYSKNSVIQSGGAISTVHSDIFCTHCRFLNNSVTTGVGAAIFQVDNTIQLYNTTFCDNKAFRSYYIIQLANIRGSCSGLMFTGNIGSMYVFYSTLNFSDFTSFTNNTAITGGALTFIQSTVTFDECSQVIINGNTAVFGGGIFLSQSEFKVYTPLLIMHNNTAIDSGGGIYAYQSQISIHANETSKSVLLSDNSAKEGGALYAIASYLNIFHGFVHFLGNEAMRGGAIALSESSKIYILKAAVESNELSIKLIFSNNSAEYGGAVYVADNSNTGVLCRQSIDLRIPVWSIECFIQTLGFYYLRPTNNSDIGLLTSINISEINYMNIFFTLNTGTIAGNDIYGGLLDRCQMNVFSEIYNFVFLRNRLSGLDYLKIIAQFQIESDNNQATNQFFPQSIINAITGDSVKSLISSDPVQLCFCKNNTHDCSYQWPRIFVKKGEAFIVQAVTVDQVENPVNGTILAGEISKGTQLKVDQSRKVTTGACSELIYNVFSTEANVTFQLYPDGPCDSNGISSKMLEVTFLPCNCPTGLQPAPLDNECRCECTSSMNMYASSCQQYNNSITVVRQTAEYWIQYIFDKNMTGFLLGSCPYDYCVDEPVNLSISLPLNVDKQCAYNRTGIMCGECEEGLSLVFASSRCVQCSNNYLALLIVFTSAGAALVAFILMLNLTVAIGTIHGLLLYANIVAANSPVFLPPKSTILSTFVSWVNLDFGIETCFYDGMESNAKVLLQLAFPIYIYLLATIIIIVSHYWGWFAGLIGRKNPVATLCTLFLLSYSKLLRTIIVILQFTRLSYPDGSDMILWTFNPNIPQFISSRTPFFLVAVTIIILGGVYTILLFFGQWLRRIRRKTFFEVITTMPLWMPTMLHLFSNIATG